MGLISAEIEKYCIDHSTRPSADAKALEDHTRAGIHGSNMLIGEMEASVLTFLIKLGKVKNIVEFGTYTGYSALVMAEQIPADGTVTTIDINPATTAIAKEYWAKSAHGKKIQQILKPGLEAMKDLDGKYDLVFIDADKNNYSNYLDWALEHLSPNGFIVVDNTLWAGKILTPGLDKQTDSIIAHNKKARDLEGYTKTLLPIRDGMFLIQKN
ncbi:O-methyltransferase [Peredibacter starrii]|uniref:O-methyltransferase n=1 Tax=Peredibacter starrii TaxID=28202 RepID=A0AAX4HJQ8_9BACT|nr:O-methyltransferase [Peredibacter starrii]WPU63463.1 O-methyltransferase [Peredibacter starrii]